MESAIQVKQISPAVSRLPVLNERKGDQPFTLPSVTPFTMNLDSRR